MQKTVVQLVADYQLGVTKAGDVIFFQIDKDGKCRTGGKSQFNERLNALKGRDIVAFPDVDGYETWTEPN